MQNVKDSVVVIDDSLMTLDSINKILSPFYNVYGYQNQEEGMEIVRRIKPSLVLVDIIMPRMSGFVVTAKLKTDPATENIPVILMTTLRDDAKSDDEETSFKLGAVDFIPKPLKPPIVLARVRTHIRLYNYFRELENITVTDALTGIYNRRGFDETLNREWKRAKREGTELSLLMLDIDNFKRYNDNYGHQSGDSALNLVAQAIKNTLLRAADTAARYGGEEFAVVLPGTDKDGARIVMENILKAVRDLNIPHEHSPAAPVITVSAGGAALNDTILEPTALIEAADKMCYKAKHEGRNRCCI